MGVRNDFGIHVLSSLSVENSLMRICFRYVDDLNNLYIKQFYLHIFHCMQMRAKHSAISFLFVCLFDCLEFINPLENCLLIFHSFVDVIITSEGLRILTYARANGHWAVRVLERATPTVTRVIRLLCSSTKTRDTHTCCRALTVELWLSVFMT